MQKSNFIKTVFFMVLISLLNSFELAANVRVINGVAVPSDFPIIETNILGETAPGRIFMSSTFFDSDSRSNYLIICENDGTPYFYRKYSRDYLGCGDFKVHSNGLLSFHKYIHSEDGLFIVLDQNFTEVDTFRCVGRDRTDSHEFVMLPNGHALLVCDHDSTIDMRKYVNNGKSQATVIGMLVQEVDSNGNLYWEWNTWKHLDIRDAINVNLRDQTIDYIHLNSIAVDYDGNYIISLNRFNEVCKVDRKTGDFIWRLGGVNNEFTFINESTMFAAQHHARPVPGKPDNYTIYDNSGARTSRAVEYKLDVTARTAEKVWEYYDNRLNSMMGSAQRLENGNTYIDWSAWPPLRACEVDAANNKVFEIEVQGISSYRSFRFDWEGMMQKPYLLAESHPEAVYLIFNKFGDPNVKEYQVVGGKTPNAMEIITTTTETYAGLTDLEDDSDYYFRVCAIDASGQKSEYSDAVKIKAQYSAPGANLIVNSDFSDNTTDWIFFTQGNGYGTGTVENGEYHVNIDYGGTEYFHVQVIQESFPIIEGRNYIFEFDAYADAQRIIEPRIAQNGGNYTCYSKTSAIVISKQKRHYQYEFTMTDPSDDQARLVLNCGGSEIDCYFDNIVVAEKTETDVPNIKAEKPANFQFLQNYPNPFNASTSLKFYLPEPSHVNATVFDVNGRLVVNLTEAPYEPGWHSLKFDTPYLGSGVYFCRINARSLSGVHSFNQTRKWILLK